MFFVGFHKLNADFFFEPLSCATNLGHRLDQDWAIPLKEFGLLPSPSAIVMAELMSAALLLFAPRAGFAMTLAFMTPIALFGPTSYVSALLGLAAAGLGPRDRRCGEGVASLSGAAGSCVRGAVSDDTRRTH